jgi:hypothetical protein
MINHPPSEPEAFRLLRKGINSGIASPFTTHLKYGNWLNQAEIEISLFARQCLGKRRIPTLNTLLLEANAWNNKINQEARKINGTFSRKKDRKKFGYTRLKSNRFKRSKTWSASSVSGSSSRAEITRDGPRAAGGNDAMV